MRKLAIALAAAALLGGCAENGDYWFGGMGGYNAYYDGYYGPYHGGYWGPDNVFWYLPAPGRPYVRDDGRHFHNRPDTGFRGVHAGHPPRTGAAPGGRGPGPGPGDRHGGPDRH